VNGFDDAVPIEIRPTIDGKATDTSDLYAYWSDARSWRSAHLMERTESSLRIPPVKPGNHSVLVAKMKGERVTHFSRIVRFEVPHDETLVLDVPLREVHPIEGVLSKNVPRPIVDGRVVVHTVPPGGDNDASVGWSTWVPIRADGTFTVESWPTDEEIQLIALCNGFIAGSGDDPPSYEGPETDFYLRPQVFDPLESSSITVEMEPLVPIAVETIDQESQPVAGVTVEAWPNVGWWNVGSQIYCESPLIKGERFLKYRSTESASDGSLPQPFRAVSGRNGIASLQLPAGKRTMGIVSDVYELPVYLGRRYARTELTAGEPKKITMHLQDKGTEQLADWDKLAGVVFGCSTREGRRILALPGVNEKMQEFTERFRDAKSYNDPELLARSYAVVASAFAEIEDFAEAARWYKKASEAMKDTNQDPADDRQE